MHIYISGCILWTNLLPTWNSFVGNSNLFRKLCTTICCIYTWQNMLHFCEFGFQDAHLRIDLRRVITILINSYIEITMVHETKYEYEYQFWFHTHSVQPWKEKIVHVGLCLSSFSSNGSECQYKPEFHLFYYIIFTVTFNRYFALVVFIFTKVFFGNCLITHTNNDQ